MSEWLNLNKNYKFAQDNNLITAQYSRKISLIGQKLVRLAIANINNLHDDDFITYKVSLIELARLLEIEENKHIYRDVKKASVELLETKILIEEKRKRGSFRRYNLFSYFDYNDGEGTVTIRFNPDMKPFLISLKKNFTQIPIEQILFMSHKYSIRVYELIKMKLRNAKVYADKHQEIEITVEELRRATSTENQYKQIGQFKEFVLKPALDDIEKNAPYHVEPKDIKEGRRIIGWTMDVWSKVGWNYVQLQKDQIEGQMTLKGIW